MPTSKRSGEKKSAAKGKRVKSREEWVTATEKVMPWVRSRAKGEQHIDPDEAPPLTEEFFERADVYHGDKLVRAGRPRSANPKQALKLRIDPDVVEYFRATGPGWQTRINDTLRKAAKLASRPRVYYSPK